uniref:Proline-rich extensin-like protein EPR1 isoform X4 n=1 Tax=Phascolarctos cinereus TaxID=38626 RepID=A0A6P5JRQ2_PHACI|nr:proline-rich extensin-like protein EPR1 isoform X4 [Phascolarctos cinereus]
MERRFRTYAKASSLVQIPQKALPYKTQSVLIPCPPHRIALLSKQDHQSQAEKMVCLRHQFSPHRSSPVCHKTEPLKNHNDKIKNKYELPTPPHPDHHGIHIITAELKCKTTASVDLFQWGEELTSPKQKFSPTVVPRGQAEAKHGPHYKVKHNLGSKQQTKAKLPPQHHPKNQATFLPFICQPGRTPPHYQSPTKYLLINIHTGPDWQPTPATTRQMNIRSDPDYQDTPVTPRPMNTGPNYQPTPATIRLMKTRPGPDYQTTSATPRPMNTGPGPNYQPTSAPPMNTGPGPDYQPTSVPPMNTGPGPDYQPISAPPMNTGPGPDYQPTSVPPMNTGPGPDYQPTPAIPMNTGPDYQPISVLPMNTGPGPDYQPISAPPMNTGPGPDYQLTPAIPMNTGPDYQPTPAIPMNTGPDYQPMSATPRLMNTRSGLDYETISATTRLMNTGPDYQTTPATPRPLNIHPGPDCQTIPTILRYEHHSKAPPDPDAQDIPPPGIYHQAQMPLDKEDYGILLRLLSNQVKDPTSQYYQKMNPPSPIQHTETPTSDYNQAEDTPSSDQPDEAQPGNQHQTQTEQNRDTPRCLNDIKPFTIEGLITLSTQVVDKIISSIPEEKIKRDIYNQVRLWQMRGCPRPTHWPERYMSASYTICLICASWIPNGCPHVHGMKCSSLAQLLAVPTPLPDSEKMNMRFYLKVPQQKPNTISTVTDYPSSKAMPSSPSPDFPSCRKADSVPLVLPKLTWLDFILARHYQQKEEKSCPGQKPPELPLTSKTNIEEKMPMRKGTQFKSLLEKFQSRRKLN